jgi:hypothetical protein
MSKESTTDLVALWQQSADAADRPDFDTAMRYFAADALWEVRPLDARPLGSLGRVQERWLLRSFGQRA